jgi:ABC-type uncharacterized transport system permease subunit
MRHPTGHLPWHGMFLLFVSSLTLAFFAADFRSPAIHEPVMPILSVMSLSGAVTTVLLSALFLASMYFAQYDDVVPPIMLCLVAMLCTVCTVVTLAELVEINRQAWESHQHPTVLLVTALGCTTIAIHLAIRFDERSRRLATLFEFRDRLAWAREQDRTRRFVPSETPLMYRTPRRPM